MSSEPGACLALFLFWEHIRHTLRIAIVYNHNARILRHCLIAELCERRHACRSLFDGEMDWQPRRRF
jgi:hypothetical protein